MSDSTLDDEYARRFASRVRHLRTERGWSQAQLAEQVRQKAGNGFIQTMVTKIESGDRAVNVGEAQVIADVLGVPLPTLLLDRPHGSRNSEQIDSEIAALQPLLDDAREAVSAARDEEKEVLGQLNRAGQRVVAAEDTASRLILAIASLRSELERRRSAELDAMLDAAADQQQDEDR